MMRLRNFKDPAACLSSCFDKQSALSKASYQIRLETSIDVLRFFLFQGLPFRGHDESEKSLNKGNFLELLKCFAKRENDVRKSVLQNAPQNCQLKCSTIQAEIIHAFIGETTKRLIKELNGDFFSILVDESADISDNEQLSLCLRYVDNKGGLKERFLGIVKVTNTKSLTLKCAIQALLLEHGLSLSQVRDQGYDGDSNMQGSINGLKSLILKESPSAYYMHCFAHQLTLIVVAKENYECSWLFDMLAPLLNVVVGSPKHKEILRSKQATRVLEALESGELESRSGGNQEIGLSRPGDTRWGSHFKTILHVLSLYPSIIEVLDILGESESEKFKIQSLVRALESFDFVFVGHLMVTIYGITNALKMALKKKDQDVVNAMTLVNPTKTQLQNTRDNGCDSHMDKVTSFCQKNGIEVPDMNAMYTCPKKSKHGISHVTNIHHFIAEVFLTVIDRQAQELESQFSKVTQELVICMSCFKPDNHFSSFDSTRLVRLTEFLSEYLSIFKFELENFIIDVRSDENFLAVKNVNELSMKLVETKKHESYPKVYLLLKLVLLLPVVTTNVERTFSAMKHIKNKVRNSMGNQLLNDCLVTFIE